MKLLPQFTLKAIPWLLLMVAVASHGWRLYREHQEREAVGGQPNERRIDNKVTAIDEPVINGPVTEKMPELGTVTELTTHAIGKWYTSKITETGLLECPNWDQDAENPPISARKALGLATKMKDSLVKDEEGCKWLLISMELHPTRLGQWAWVAKYRRTPWFGAIVPFDELAIVVTMDGTVIEPKVSNSKYAEPDDGEPRGERIEWPFVE